MEPSSVHTSTSALPPPLVGNERQAGALARRGGGRVRLCLLGGFELEIDGTPRSLPRAGQRIVALVALAPRGVSRMFTAFQLWPDSVERRAMANLRSTLWRLHQLPVDVITASGGHLRLADSVWVDIRHGVNEQSQGAETPRTALLPFGAAFADLLPDWYDDWLTVERERYRQWSLQLLERRAGEALAGGRAQEALQLALAAVAIDPVRDRAHQVVLAAHRREGNGVDARREMQRYERCIASMLDAESGALTAAGHG